MVLWQGPEAAIRPLDLLGEVRLFLRVLGRCHHWRFWAADVAEDDNEDEELILAPILLLAGQENEAHELTSKDRDLLKELVGESVMNIFRFWLPYREQALNQLRNNPDKPKIIPFDIDASLSGPDIQ